MPVRFSRRKFSRKSKSGGILAKKGKLPHMERQIMGLKRFVKAQAQRGYTDFDSGAISFTTSGIIRKLFTVPTVGSSINSRIGDEVRVYAMLISVTIAGGEQNSLLSADEYNVCGYKIGYSYKPDGGGLPLITGVNGIFDNTTFASSNLCDAPLGNDVMNAIKVLKHVDCVVTGLDTGSSSTGAVPYVREHVYHNKHLIKFRSPVKCDFNAQTDASASFNTFLPWLSAISDSSATPNPNIRVSCRVYYYL